MLLPSKWFEKVMAMMVVSGGVVCGIGRDTFVRILWPFVLGVKIDTWYQIFSVGTSISST